MTWRSERRIAAVTDRVVHDYAAIAVWQYARRANMALHDEVMQAFSGAPPMTHVRSDPAVTTRTVDAHVAELRRKREVNPAEPRHILTVHKVGYRLRI